MRVFLKSFLIVTAFLSFNVLSAAVSPAQADVFYVEDDENDFSFSYPDRWARIHNQKSDDVYTIAAPGRNDHATCRIRVREDRRHLIYPVHYSADVQNLSYSKDFWDEYLGEYRESYLISVTDNAGLGRGFASFANAYFVTAVGPKVQKRGIMFAALHNDRAYIVECSAQVEAYERWHKVFLSVVKSVDFPKILQQSPTGNYRKFLNDCTLVINGKREIDTTYH